MDHTVTESPAHGSNPEAAVGITEFVSLDLLGFQAYFKKRHTDFLVNEILPSGEVVHLTDISHPSFEVLSHDSNKSESLRSHEPTSKHPREAYTSGQKDLINELEQGVPSAEHATLAREQAKPHSSPILPASGPPSPSTITSVSQDGPLSADPSPATNTFTQTTHSSPSNRSDKAAPDKLPPHLRIPVQPPSIPLSMQDVRAGQSEASESEAKKRKKEQKILRRTSQGWIEVDAEQEKESKKLKADADMSAGINNEHNDTTEDPMVEENAMPPPPVPSTQAQWQAFAGQESTFKLSREDRNFLVNQFGSEIVDAIIALYEQILDSPSRKAKDYGSVKSSILPRQIRSKIHQNMRRIFQSRLATTTDNQGAMIISAMPSRRAFLARTPTDNGKVGGRNIPQFWKDKGGEYLHFSLFKVNADTVQAVSYLAKQLLMRPNAFQFAGTKDRRAATTQRVSVYRIMTERIFDAGSQMRSGAIGDFEYRPHPLQLGELKGNEFTITLRECDFSYPVHVDSETAANGARAIIATSTKALMTRGFLNYFGLQRFGSFSIGTEDIGIKLLNENFKDACEALLYFSPDALSAAKDSENSIQDVSRDDQLRALAIHEWNTTGKARPALTTMPPRFHAETNIIRYLSRDKQRHDYKGALSHITRNVLLIYVHAYQSLVWNVVASARWKQYGSAVIEGDLVLVHEHEKASESEVEGEAVDSDGEAIVQPAAEDRAISLKDMFIRARALTKEEAESGNFTIFDVVLPTPGYDIIYPANKVAQVYQEFMASERGGRLDPYNMRRKWKITSLSGSYRKLLGRPLRDIDFDIKVYKSEDEQFVQTDLDRILEKEKNEACEHVQTACVEKMPHTEVPPTEPGETDRLASANLGMKSDCSDSEQGGVKLSDGAYRDDKIAVILKLQLGASQYATMALREMMKQGGMRHWKPDFSGGR